MLNYFYKVPSLLESPGFYLLKIPGPGKSCKITLVLESPRKIALKVMHFSGGSNRKQAAIVCVDYCLLK